MKNAQGDATPLPKRWVDAVAGAVLRWPLEQVEAALVKRFMREHGLESVSNKLLLKIRELESPALEAQEVLDLDALVKSFEVLVPPLEAKLYGSVFTPSPITKFMAEEVLGHSAGGKSIIDPACGCGALLVAALRRLVQGCGMVPSEALKLLHGVDVSAQSVERAKILLSLTALALGEDVEEIESVLVVGDSLSMDWAEAFPRTQGKFDIVLGNPPYVRYHHLPVEKRKQLSQGWETLKSGSPNLYFAFFELSRRISAPSGRVCYITPNNFFATKAAGALRKWLTGDGGLQRIVDFGHAKVFDALTYTSISFLGDGATHLEYANLSTAAELDGLSAQDYVTTPLSELGESPWRLVGAKDAKAIEKIVSTGKRLDEVAEIRYGIKTCRDRVYLVDGKIGDNGLLSKRYLGQTWYIEPGITKEHSVVPDSPSEGGLVASTQRIIYPYTLKEGKAEVIDEDTLSESFPNCYRYLKAVRSELENRDKGAKTYSAWYAYARTQALVPLEGKLLTPEYAAKPRFMLDPRPASLFSNGCALKPKNGLDIRTLQHVMNSAVFHYFIDKTSTSIDGGFKSYQKSRIAPFGVLELTGEEELLLTRMSPREVDLFLADKYGIEIPSEYLRS